MGHRGENETSFDDGERSNHFCGYQNLHQQQVTTNPASKIAERETKAVMLGANPGRTLLINFDMKYIDADRLRAEIEKRLKNTRDYMNGAGMKYKGPKHFKAQGKESAYDALLNIIDSLQQEQPELYKDESLGSPDYERGFKHGRDFQAECELKKTDEEKVISYLISKGYPVSINGKIPSYEETFELIKNAIEYANQQEQSTRRNV